MRILLFCRECGVVIPESQDTSTFKQCFNCDESLDKPLRGLFSDEDAANYPGFHNT